MPLAVRAPAERIRPLPSEVPHHDEHRDSGAIEFAYPRMAAAASVETAEPALLSVASTQGGERFFAAKRFDRNADRKRHVMIASGLSYANHRQLSLNYGDLRRTAWTINRDARDVEKMARPMTFNALAHKHDDDAKNVALCYGGQWRLAPAYDLTFSRMQGAAMSTLRHLPEAACLRAPHYSMSARRSRSCRSTAASNTLWTP